MKAIAVGVLALFLAFPARPEEGEAIFEGTVGSQPIARETSRWEAGADGVTLTSDGTWRLPGGEVKIHAVTTYAGTPLAPVRMTMDATSAAGAQKIEVTFQPGKVAFHATAGGPPVDRTGDLAHAPVLLENLVFAHYRALPSAVDPAATEPRTFSLVVPQSMLALPMVLRPAGAAQVIGPAGPVAADRWELEAAGVVSTLFFAREPRQFVGSRVPLQRFELRRNGWQLPEEASAPAPYVDPAKFQSLDLPLASGTYTMPGTLCVPAGAGPFPAVVLVHGSGPNDRDETIGPNKPLRDLAEGLACRGVAVYRYDKRTFVHGAAMAKEPVTLEAEAIDDAVAALSLVRARPEADPARVFVLGHSLGAMLAPEIAALDGKVAGAILLAAPARPMADVLVEQFRHLADLAVAAGVPGQEGALKTTLEQLEKVKSGGLADGESFLGGPAAYWRQVLAYDVPARIRKLAVPVLALQGERDYQVRPADLEVIDRTLREAGNPASRAKCYPALNHLFMAGEGKSAPAEYGRPGHVAEQVIADLAAWILERK